jgi:hypothetical protein
MSIKECHGRRQRRTVGVDLESGHRVE